MYSALRRVPPQRSAEFAIRVGVFDDLLTAANERAALFTPLPARPAKRLAVLTCMDARIDPLRIFGLRPGDAAVIRNAGARIDDSTAAALAIARDMLDVERVLVLGHTDCRGTEDAAQTVPEDVERAGPQLPGLALGGFVYDVDTGRVSPAGR